MDIFRHKKPPPIRVGLGLKLTSDLMVTEVVEGGPCSELVREGDFLTHVGKVDVRRKQLTDIAKFTLGDEGSKTNLMLMRGCQPLNFDICRKFVQVKPVKDIVRAQVEQGFRRRNSIEIARIFAENADGDQLNPSTLHLPKDKLLVALKEFSIGSKDITDEDLKNLEFQFSCLDRNGDGKLDLSEFKLAVQSPSELEEWVRALNIQQLVADAIPRKEGEDPLLTASNLSSQVISDICDEITNGLRKIISEGVTKLKQSFNKMDARDVNNLAVKFQSKTPKLNCGDMDDFRRGIMAYIGSPDLHFESAMESEHCCRACADFEFETKNYHIKTTPSKEWMIVTGRMECPKHQMDFNRRIPKTGDLLSLSTAKEANLQKAEVYAIVLYTGPMYMIYNTVLRRYPVELFQELKKFNGLFTTTIFTLVSAVHKLSWVGGICSGMKLYRGLKEDFSLPDHFFKSDKNGCSGFTEYAFMSTTSKIKVALTYARSDGEDGAVGVMGKLFVIEVGSVDRGASVKDFSQYEDENEYLYAPFSFVQLIGVPYVEVTDDCGVIRMIPVKINTNLKTRTLEEQLEMKKEMHVTAFRHHIDDIEVELNKRSSTPSAAYRLKSDKSAGENHTLEGFVARIVEQCKDVLSRHKAMHHQEYINDAIYRNLVLEMIDVKSMAIAKFDEWLQNDSFIRFRWNGTLRGVHRLWTAHLDQKRLACEAGPDKQSAAIELCKACGWIVESVDEKNELGETRLMCAAAEGRSAGVLQCLIDAGACVNYARPDGVTPIWLAAQGGHDKCIRGLVGLNATVSKASNDGATPLYIAARNGKFESIKVLAELKADVNEHDNQGSYPVHQAALYGHNDAIEELIRLGADINQQDGNRFLPCDVASGSGHYKCADFIKSKGGKEAGVKEKAAQADKNLIISTGDISDIDGFFALAEYAKTGSDVLFVMNYPAYIGVDEKDVDSGYANHNPGLGYRYSAKQVFDKVSSLPDHYAEFLSAYTSASDDNERMKCAMTDIAFKMANKIWDEVPGTGKLMFGIGGINSVNPFSESAIKNEVLVYSEVIQNADNELISPEQGTVYASSGEVCTVCWSDYSNIYMDFNGSLAFWNGYLAQSLSQEEVVGKIQGVFIMGGVYADREPITMPAIPNVLNRFSSATMNQLYHPQSASDFFAFLAQFKIKTWTISNNVVQSLDSFDPQTNQKTDQGIESFLSSNGLSGEFLKKCALLHYHSRYNPPRKPFDYYCAIALCTLLRSMNRRPLPSARDVFDVPRLQTLARVLSAVLPSRQMHMFYSNVYGITFISSDDTWKSTRSQYSNVIDTEIKEGDAENVKSKKDYFKKEIELMNTIDYLSSLAVFDLSFHVDDTKKIRVGNYQPHQQ